MTYRVIHYNPYATKVAHWRDLRGRKMPLPAGSAFLNDAATEMPHRETTLFLAHVAKRSAKKRKRREAGNTAYTYAGELKPYLEFLQWFGVEWGDADPEILFAYIDTLCGRRHRLTGAALDPTTLERRVRRVIQAYQYTNRQNITDIEIDADDLVAELWEAVDADATSDGAPDDSDAEEGVRHIPDADWALIQKALGSLPSEIPDREEGDTAKRRPSGRNRLIGDTAITTGMRGIELAGLPLKPMLAVEVTDENLSAWTRVRITDTKGGKWRNVFIANALVREIQKYAATDRAEAVAAGVAIGNKDPGTVFVNAADTGKEAGRAMRAQQLSNIFRDAVREALPTIDVPISDERGERVYQRPRFRLHDARHSFAMRLFNKLVAAGKEPWDIIQGRLGHARVATTRNIYLDMSRSAEPLAADLVAAGMDRLIYG